MPMSLMNVMLRCEGRRRSLLFFVVNLLLEPFVMIVDGDREHFLAWS
jgi:hypothetical protein